MEEVFCSIEVNFYSKNVENHVSLTTSLALTLNHIDKKMEKLKICLLCYEHTKSLTSTHDKRNHIQHN